MVGSIFAAALMVGVMATFAKALVTDIHQRDAYRTLAHVRSFSDAIALHHRAEPHDDLAHWVTPECSNDSLTDEATCTGAGETWGVWQTLPPNRRALIIHPQDKAYLKDTHIGRVTDRTPYGDTYELLANGLDDVIRLRFIVTGRDPMARLLAQGLEGRVIEVNPRLDPAHDENEPYEVLVDLQPGMANIMRHWTLANRTDEHTNFVMQRPLPFSPELVAETGECSDLIFTDEAACTGAGETWTAAYRPELDCDGMGLGVFPAQDGYMIACTDEGSCSDPTERTRPECEAPGACSDPAHTTKVACEAAVETWTPVNTWTPVMRASAVSPYIRE
ncbi:MAG: hypothetical protein F4Z82_15935 [Caldilineaceae bacterium SB0668_bin_21]|nr:hypothetical protein [Caldilineaceae bacterium SB0668_bin_21]